jgi:hypothetical protein
VIDKKRAPGSVNMGPYADLGLSWMGSIGNDAGLSAHA